MYGSKLLVLPFTIKCLNVCNSIVGLAVSGFNIYVVTRGEVYVISDEPRLVYRGSHLGIDDVCDLGLVRVNKRFRKLRIVVLDFRNPRRQIYSFDDVLAYSASKFSSMFLTRRNSNLIVVFSSMGSMATYEFSLDAFTNVDKVNIVCGVKACMAVFKYLSIIATPQWAGLVPLSKMPKMIIGADDKAIVFYDNVVISVSRENIEPIASLHRPLSLCCGVDNTLNPIIIPLDDYSKKFVKRIPTINVLRDELPSLLEEFITGNRDIDLLRVGSKLILCKTKACIIFDLDEETFLRIPIVTHYSNLAASFYEHEDHISCKCGELVFRIPKLFSESKPFELAYRICLDLGIRVEKGLDRNTVNQKLLILRTFNPVGDSTKVIRLSEDINISDVCDENHTIEIKLNVQNVTPFHPFIHIPVRVEKKYASGSWEDLAKLLRVIIVANNSSGNMVCDSNVCRGELKVRVDNPFDVKLQVLYAPGGVQLLEQSLTKDILNLLDSSLATICKLWIYDGKLKILALKKGYANLIVNGSVTVLKLKPGVNTLDLKLLPQLLQHEEILLYDSHGLRRSSIPKGVKDLISNMKVILSNGKIVVNIPNPLSLTCIDRNGRQFLSNVIDPTSTRLCLVHVNGLNSIVIGELDVLRTSIILASLVAHKLFKLVHNVVSDLV